jgi:hypothetical protein
MIRVTKAFLPAIVAAAGVAILMRAMEAPAKSFSTKRPFADQTTLS